MTTSTIPSHPVFRDPVLDEKFRRDGYVVTPLLNAEEVQQLLAMHDTYTPVIPQDYYSTIFHSDREHRAEVGRAIDLVVQPRALPMLVGYKRAASGFISKAGTTKQGRVPMHQDYSFVDQSKYTGVHVWIPLIDVNEDNGCLSAYPGTHSLINHTSAIPGPSIRCHPSPYDAVRSLVEENCGVPIPMPAGSALFYNERVLHGSGENNTPDKRVVAVCAYVPEHEPMYLYCPSPDSPQTLDILAVRDSAELQLIPGVAMPYPYPEFLTQVGTMEFHIEPLTPEQVLPFYTPEALAALEAKKVAQAARDAKAAGDARVVVSNATPQVGTTERVTGGGSFLTFLKRAKKALFSNKLG